MDIFGRHSPLGPEGPWYQWSPPPDPRPWYYRDPPGDRPVHPFAVNTADRTPPPPPSGIEAFALDPADPTVLKDTAYQAWWSALTASSWYRALPEADRRNLIGLRVRWLWTQEQMSQAPDTREFRVYFQTGRLNERLGRTIRVIPAGAESDVETDIADSAPPGAYQGASLRVSQDFFTVLGSQGSPLRLRVRNLGPAHDVGPAANAPCTLTIPPGYAEGRISITAGSPTLTGVGTAWSGTLAGQKLQVAGDLTTYTVARVDSPTQLTLDRNYEGPTASGKGYDIRHPLFVDYGDSANWGERYHVVGYNQGVTVAQDAGRSVRRYEVFLPAADGAYRQGLPLTTSLADPIAFGWVGVSAADGDAGTPDDPRWSSGRWGGRPGNESKVGAPAQIFRVRAEKPPAPRVPPYVAERAFATPADAHGRSYYTFRWLPTPHLRTHIFRVLDDTLFKDDWSRRPGSAIDAGQLQLFPDVAVEPRYGIARNAQVANELNRLNDFGHDVAGTGAAMAYYRVLSPDALRVLAGLPDNEQAFAQLTIQPLDSDDPSNANRVGPDKPTRLRGGPGIRAYVDVLDGCSTNRSFYRSAYVDSANNRSALSLSSPPVWLPNVVPPRTPAITKVLGGDQQVTLSWASNREPDLAEYRVYRAETEVDACDLRLMTLMHTEAVVAGDSTTRPADVSWTDKPLPGEVTFYYRLAAVDDAGNISDPSPPMAARAFDEALPAPPPTRSHVGQRGG